MSSTFPFQPWPLIFKILAKFSWDQIAVVRIDQVLEKGIIILMFKKEIENFNKFLKILCIKSSQEQNFAIIMHNNVVAVRLNVSL